MSPSFVAGNILKDLCRLAEQPGTSSKVRNQQTRRRHDCRRGTHECVRHRKSGPVIHGQA
jgi:hypothetical protein